MNSNAYTDIINSLHFTHRLNAGGKPAGSAVSRYPNIGAELEASGERLETLAAFANVSPAVMAAVIEDREELLYKERIGAARLFGASAGYIQARTLQTFKSGTNKGKRRTAELQTMLNRISREDLERLSAADKEDYHKARRFLFNVRTNPERDTPYAEYRWNVIRLHGILERLKPATPARTERLYTA